MNLWLMEYVVLKRKPKKKKREKNIDQIITKERIRRRTAQMNFGFLLSDDGDVFFLSRVSKYKEEEEAKNENLG